nr:MAG TPA: hypothetical protein [Caudoviricetes sp.]DAX04582.1 MAG TPA: hypothetical protein [Bacteriophage sp.]
MRQMSQPFFIKLSILNYEKICNSTSENRMLC